LARKNAKCVAYCRTVNPLSAVPSSSTLQTPLLRIHLLGPMQIERDGVHIHLPRRKVESLLAYLLLHPERHTRDHLATLLWGDSSDTQARHSLRTALATVRQQVSADLLLTDRDHVQLNPDFPLWTDLGQLLELEKIAGHTSNDLANSGFLQAHLALWQGELLAGLYDEWVTGAREHYQTRLLKLLLQITHHLRTQSSYEQAITVAQSVLEHDPANEHAHQHLMFCYVASGDRPAALRQYEQCERALLEELDAPPLPETTALYEWIKSYGGDESSSAAKITNLPIPLSSFVGRTQETAEVKRLLAPSRGQAVRLLTLIGAGGNGKTRLAIQVATDLIDSFDHGVWWVELAALSDGALVARAVAKTLGVNEVADQPLVQNIAASISDKAMLLVLDNCEHLIEACAQLTADLLARCPNLQILTTSREPLNITGELLWQVPPFAVPDPTKMDVLDLLMQFESLRLFVERAAAVRPGFTLTLENAQAVAEICQRLDGIPLAIELAAARVKALSVEQIAAYLKSVLGARFELLTQGSRAAMPRHQTLRATIDWSYALLDEEERRLFRQIAIFRGGFTLELLEQVVAAASPGLRSPFTLDLLTQLVDKSLVMVERHAGEHRYYLLETLREYALEQFQSDEELHHLQQQHAETFLRLTIEAEPELIRRSHVWWLDRLEVEHANLRAALLHFIENRQVENALRMATGVHRFWEVRGYVTEGRAKLEAALAHRASAHVELQAQALNAAGRLAFRQGDLEYAKSMHEEALHLYERTEDEIGIADCFAYLSVIHMDHGEYESAQQRLEQALQIYQAANNELGIANALSRLGFLAWDQDRFADAADCHRSSLVIYRKHDMPMSIAYETLGVGDAERMLNNFETSRAHCEECLTIARACGHKGLMAAALKSLGLLASRQGDFEQARVYGEESLEIFLESGDRTHAAFAYSHLGDVALKLGDFPKALAYFGQYLQTMFEIGYKWPIFYALEDIAELLTLVQQHTEAAVRFLGAAECAKLPTQI
jgi:predicted ATPase/DNA-binding SARP family transcriptional activator